MAVMRTVEDYLRQGCQCRRSRLDSRVSELPEIKVLVTSALCDEDVRLWID